MNVAIVGATGLVGGAFLDILAERNFPINHLYLLASEKSVGKTVVFKGDSYSVRNVETFDWSQVELALFSAGAEVAKCYAPSAAKAGCYVIDNSSAFRAQDDIPLVIPEINIDLLRNYKGRIIANPNCSTIQLLVALYPIYQKIGIKRIIVSTYQAASGAGSTLINDMNSQLALGRCRLDVGSQPLAFNVIPKIDEWQSNGYTREEMKICWESRKILNDPTLLVSATAVRVPVVNGHSESVTIELNQAVSLDEVNALLAVAPGVKVVEEGVVTPLEVSGSDHVVVSRIRKDLAFEHGLSMWVVADNIRKGAALNAIQIAEFLQSVS